MKHRGFSASSLPELSKLSLFLSPPLGAKEDCRGGPWPWANQLPSLNLSFRLQMKEAELGASEGLFCSMIICFTAEKIMG